MVAPSPTKDAIAIPVSKQAKRASRRRSSSPRHLDGSNSDSDSSSSSSSSSSDSATIAARRAAWARFFPEVRTRTIARLAMLLLTLLGLAAASVVAIASQLDSAGDATVELVSAGLSAGAATVGIVCTYFRDRGGLMWTFLLLAWSMSNGTQFLYGGIRDASRVTALCASGVGSEAAADDPFAEVCDRGKVLSLARVVVSTLTFGLSFVAAWTVYTLSEKLQDDANAGRREKEIEFAMVSVAKLEREVRRMSRVIEKLHVARPGHTHGFVHAHRGFGTPTLSSTAHGSTPSLVIEEEG